MKRFKSDQRGLVSIIITMIIMIVITLIVIGFAQITRREQRQALDRQLSTQAFYAAETGINAAVKAIQQQGYTSEKTNCAPDASGPLSAGSANNVLDAAAGVEYSCLLIDPTPATLEYSSIDIDQASVIPLTPITGSLDNITLSWQDKTGNTAFNGCLAPSAGQYNFPAVSAWPTNCNAGVLRIDLVPRDASLSRGGMAGRSLTAFLYPQAGGTAATDYTYNVSNPDKGAIIPVNCNSSSSPRKCNISIKLTGTAGASSYYLRVRSIYKTNALTITGFLPGNQQVELIEAQALVDSTGKANDVLRRIAVRVPLSNIGNGVPNFAIQASDSICKRFGIAPTFSPTPDNGEPACQIN